MASREDHYPREKLLNMELKLNCATQRQEKCKYRKEEIQGGGNRGDRYPEVETTFFIAA